MCHRELGPGTVYGRLFVNPVGDLKAEPNGSMDLNEFRTLSLVTLIPLDRRLPHIMDIPEYGISLLMSEMSDSRSPSLISDCGSLTSS